MDYSGDYPPSVNDRAQGFDLLTTVAEGDPDALAELYDRYADLVFRLAYWTTKSDADAADVTQDVFIGLPEALPSLRATDWRGFEAWLKTIAVRTGLQVNRNKKRRSEVALAATFLYARRGDTNSPVDRIAISKALAQLTEKQRTVFTLKEIEGFSHKEIAKILGISVAASEVRRKTGCLPTA